MRSRAWSLAVLVVAALAPLVLTPYWQHIAITALLFAFLGSAWNLVGGYLGAFSFAHPLFFAAGGYTTALLGIDWGTSPWVALVVAAALAVLVGLAIDWLASRFRLPMLSYALSTLAFSFMGLFVVRSLPALGGVNGLYILPGEDSWWHLQFARKEPFYYVILASLVATIGLVRWLERSRLGLYARAVRDNEAAAAAVGVPVLGTRLRCTALSAALTALGGVFYARFALYVDPVTFLSPHMYIQVILFTAVGGMGTAWGPVVGSLLLAPVGEILRGTVSTQYAAAHQLLYGLVFVGVILLMPHGVMGTLAAIGAGRRGARGRGSSPRGGVVVGVVDSAAAHGRRPGDQRDGTGRAALRETPAERAGGRPAHERRETNG